MRKSRITKMILCAMFAAITAVLSQIAIPIGPIPINLATFAVFCAGALLGPRLGALSMTVWVALGAVGVPVFTMLSGGFAILTGPTGGFIIGYIPAAFLVGLIIDKANSRKIYVYPIAMIAGAVIYFTLGTVWFMVVMITGPVQALMACVVPFLIGDAVKIVAATSLCFALRPIVYAKPVSPAKTS